MSCYRTPSPFSGRQSGRARTCLYIAVAVILSLTLLLYTPLPHHAYDYRVSIVEQFKGATFDSGSTEVAIQNDQPPTQNSTFGETHSKYAYATFLAGDSAASPGDDNAAHDNYFIATRILAYQLLHAPRTMTTHGYPFIVLVTSDVSENKRDRLRRDGAIVWEAPAIDAGYVTTDVSTWQKVMTKLRLWELTQFERICFLDGDTVLNSPLDGIFEDPAVTGQTTTDYQEGLNSDEAALPEHYAFAGVPEMKIKHHYPPSADAQPQDWPNINYLNAGFFVLQPSYTLLKYYISLTTLEGRINPHLPEQNLLNYAHRREGKMPWRQLNVTWSMHYPTLEDLEGGVASLHEKWWAPVDERLTPFLLSWRWRMEGFWEARAS